MKATRRRELSRCCLGPKPKLLAPTTLIPSRAFRSLLRNSPPTLIAMDRANPRENWDSRGVPRQG